MNAGSYNLMLILGGLVLGLFGWLLYWAGIPIIGGLIGACAGGALGLFVVDFMHLAPNMTWLPVCTGIVLGGVLGVLLMRAIQVYFFFAVGACGGGVLMWRLIQQHSIQSLMGAASAPGWGVMLAVVIGAVLGGLLLVRFRRFIIAVVTSIAGVLLLTAGLPPQYQFMGGLIGLVVFLAAQIGLVRRFIEAEAFDRRMGRHRRERPNVETHDED